MIVGVMISMRSSSTLLLCVLGTLGGCADPAPLPHERSGYQGPFTLIVTDGDRETRLVGRLVFEREPRAIELHFEDGTSWFADATGVTTGTVEERRAMLDPVELGRFALLEKALFSTPSADAIEVREPDRTVYVDGPLRTEVLFREAPMH